MASEIVDGWRGKQWMQIQARKIIILPSIILPLFLLRPAQSDYRNQTSTSLFCPFIILSSLTTSKFQDKIMGGQNDFRILVSRSRTPRWLRKSSMAGGENNGCKSRLAKLLFSPPLFSPPLFSPPLFSPPLFSLCFCSELRKAITGFKRALHYSVLSSFCLL